MFRIGRTKSVSKPISRDIRPAITPEARENQLIGLAVDLAEKQLLEGTASSQVITHYLKLATQKEKLEREILEAQKDLAVAKKEMYQSQKASEEMYREAIKAMRNYSGEGDPEEYDI